MKNGKRARGDGDIQQKVKRARPQVKKPKKPNNTSKNLAGSSRTPDESPHNQRMAKHPSKTSFGALKGRDVGGGTLEDEENVKDGAVTEEDGEKDDDSGGPGGRGSNVKAISDIMTFATRMEDGRF